MECIVILDIMRFDGRIWGMKVTLVKIFISSWRFLASVKIFFCCGFCPLMGPKCVSCSDLKRKVRPLRPLKWPANQFAPAPADCPWREPIRAGLYPSVRAFTPSSGIFKPSTILNFQFSNFKFIINDPRIPRYKKFSYEF